MTGVTICLLLYCSSIVAQHGIIETKGMWIEGAAGIQSSGIIPSASNAFWIIGDQNTKLAGIDTKMRVFKVTVDPGNRVASTQGEKGIVIHYGAEKYNGDFEGVCRQSGSTSIFAVTESLVVKGGGTQPSVFEFDETGKLIQRRSELKLNEWGSGLNKRLEGVACGDREIFLAFEEPPKILWLSYEESRMGDKARAKNNEAIIPTELNLKIGDVKNINGLHFYCPIDLKAQVSAHG